MALVYSFFHDDVRESTRSEEENRKIGLVPIDTQRGVIWANPNNRNRVLQKFGSPLIAPPPPPLQNNVLGPPPPPPNNVLGPPPPPNSVKGPSPLALLLKKGPPPVPSPSVEKAPPKEVKKVEKTTESNKSSAVPKEQMDAFVTGLVEKSELGFPVYSVCDNNSFHTSGYLWGYYAALMVKKLRLPPGPIAVVNFDSHQDAGQSTTEVVASDRWGSHLIKAMKELGFPACYLSVFNRLAGRGPGATNSYFGSIPSLNVKALSEEVQRDFKLNCLVPRKGDNAYQQKMDDIRAQFRTFWEVVQQHFGEPIKYVFFTIDRDVLDASFTQWGNGAILGASQLIELMEAAFEPINILRGSQGPQAKLIGFDITGMPESVDWQHQTPSGGFGIPKVVWSKLSRELYEVLNFVHSRLLDARRSIFVPHVFFFSGSVSYTSATGGEDKNTWNCWHYVSHLAEHLKLLVASNNVYFHEGWSYLLCQQAAPIYDAAWKSFTLYQPEKAPKPCKSQETAQIQDEQARQQKMREIEETMKPQLGVGTKLGGFACTGGVSDATKFLNPGKTTVSFTDMVKRLNAFAPPG